MNKPLLTLIITALFMPASLAMASQHSDELDSLPEEDTLGGIGGTGIRSMNRPELIERPEYLERPEILESRDAIDDSLDLDASLDTEGADFERPEVKED